MRRRMMGVLRLWRGVSGFGEGVPMPRGWGRDDGLRV